jgi:hypothetical protein
MKKKIPRKAICKENPKECETEIEQVGSVKD